MSDDELEAVALQAYDLTEIARQVLQAEISRRHLQVALQLQAPNSEEEEEQLPPQGYPDGFDPEDWGLISFRYVKTLEEARQLKECLDPAGIPSYYGPKLVDDLRLLPASLDKSIQVKVREVDLNRARAVLRRCAPPSDDEKEEEIPDYAGRCPECHSKDIVLEGVDDAEPETDAGSMYHWSCEACGHQWEDDGVESQP